MAMCICASPADYTAHAPGVAVWNAAGRCYTPSTSGVQRW
jgi:hypothetical protein